MQVALSGILHEERAAVFLQDIRLTMAAGPMTADAGNRARRAAALQARGRHLGPHTGKPVMMPCNA